MRDYASIIKKSSFGFIKRTLQNKKKHSALAALCAMILVFSVARFWDGKSANLVLADTEQFDNSEQIKLLMSGDPKDILVMDNNFIAESGKKTLASTGQKKEGGNEDLENRLYEMVGNSPIREMVPFIAKRDQRTAAFLVGIAKKESSFGFASPSKNGETCHNYWGYKGSAGRGTGMGYACFASAEEAVQVVGDRLDVLVEKKRDTPARMVDTWKCGRSCAGDPGAPGWVSAVASIFDKIVTRSV